MKVGGLLNQPARVWVLGVVAAAIGLALYGRASERADRQLEAQGGAGASGGMVSVEPADAPFPAEELRTLPVGEAASEADGLLELQVTESERPVSRAQVRLYRQGGKIPETGRVDWRVAAAGATGNDGKLLMPARAGRYLVVARSEGFAPAFLTLTHPLGGNRTPVHLRLEEPVSFFGRTVMQGTGKPMAGAELTLTPFVSPWEQELRADAPAEERVTVTSDAEGRFSVEGLASGPYTVEGRARGSSLTVDWTLRLPLAAPRVLALPRAGGLNLTRLPQRAPSKELRCGY